MATFARTVRRGLPRVPGGDPWPPAGVVAGADADAGDATAEAAGADGAAAPQSLEYGAATSDRAEATAEPTSATGASVPADAPIRLRQGLPRTPGGEPWPPAGLAPAPDAAGSAVRQPLEHGAAISDRAEATVEATGAAGAAVRQPLEHGAAISDRAEATAEADGVALRQGLPRTVGGDPWPPAGTVSAARPVRPAQPAPAPGAAATPAPAPATLPVAPRSAQRADETPAAAGAAAPAAATLAPTAPTDTDTSLAARAPLPFTRTVWPGRAATHRPAPRPEPRRLGPFTVAQWTGAVIVGGIGLLIAAGMAVALVRVLLSTGPLADFVATYPGEYHLPDGAPVGIPAWIGWQHFFNAFLMLLIIRTGLTVRTEKRPAVFWTPKKDKKGKTSLTIWFHQALDVLWLVNGAVFVVLLFVTGQWMRIVPTSWEVFPNAVSAALQYVSLDWPTENGWVNYNSLQQLAYFATVFLAAPLAAITGYRMSGIWPKKNAKLNAAWPIDWARKVHFPVMLYFVVFIAIHVFLVFATGALRNLNHMYAAQGSVDPTAYADNWTGFWFFVASLVVMAAAWVAARPLTIAPIARLFGTVSGR